MNKNITLNANPESEEETGEINCIIIDNNLERYTLNCRLDNKIKYDLNNSLSIIDKSILLIIFEDRSIIIDNTNSDSNHFYKAYSKKNSGLNAGIIITIILVIVIVLALLISIIIFLKRKNNNKIGPNSSLSAIKINSKN